MECIKTRWEQKRRKKCRTFSISVVSGLHIKIDPNDCYCIFGVWVAFIVLLIYVYCMFFITRFCFHFHFHFFIASRIRNFTIGFNIFELLIYSYFVHPFKTFGFIICIKKIFIHFWRTLMVNVAVKNLLPRFFLFLTTEN